MDQMDKNTVSAKNQLKESSCVMFEHLERDGLRVMFMGNSITCHGIKHEIGWHNRWGMAASAKEKDYVHLCMAEIEKRHPQASFCICQISQWEVNYKNGEEIYPVYESARDFAADVIIFRAVENCPKAGYVKEEFKRSLEGLMDYLNPNDRGTVLVTTGFWKHPADEAIRAYAADKGWELCELGDLGERDEMKAIGLFEHTGVANHPGDLGMKAMAERIMEKISGFENYAGGMQE